MLCRHRKRPARFSFGTVGTDHFTQSPKDMYRSIYFNALDNTIVAVKFQFKQTDWIVFKNIQELFLRSLQGENFEEPLGEVHQLYKDDFKGDDLKAQMETLRYFPESTIDNAKELVDFVQSLSATTKTFVPQVITLAKILLVMPATNAVGEHSFSPMKRVRTYLCSTTSDCRLNHLMVLHVHKGRTDSLNMVEVANAFVKRNDSRHPIFGIFGEKDGVPK